MSNYFWQPFISVWFPTFALNTLMVIVLKNYQFFNLNKKSEKFGCFAVWNFIINWSKLSKSSGIKYNWKICFSYFYNDRSSYRERAFTLFLSLFTLFFKIKCFDHKWLTKKAEAINYSCNSLRETVTFICKFFQVLIEYLVWIRGCGRDRVYIFSRRITSQIFVRPLKTPT